MEHFEIIIIGGGPGGLACAKVLAQAGKQVLLLEQKKIIGDKVCAGGITWSGLIQRVPEHLVERAFHKQLIFSHRQKIIVKDVNPITATVNRRKLGQWMMRDVISAGAVISPGCRVKKVSDQSVFAVDNDGRSMHFGYDHLVGADGSSSMIRRFLGLGLQKVGTGINYQLPGHYDNMEWHLDSRLFGSGYGWIFPHRDTVSIGAYSSRHNMSPIQLKKNLIQWAESRGFQLRNEHARAQLINFDYQGCHFDRLSLIGDAAGLTSGLTGEGIHPAIVSGEAVAKKIIDPHYPENEIARIVRKQHRHEQVLHLAEHGQTVCSLLMETLIFMLRIKLLDFHALEMAD